MTTYAVSQETNGDITVSKTAGQSNRSLTMVHGRADHLYWDFIAAIGFARSKKSSVSFTFTTSIIDIYALTFDGTADEADAFARQFKAALSGKVTV